jgi:excisionase family DNA binding protein
MRQHPSTSTEKAAGSIRFFTISAVAEMLDVSTRTVRRWIDDGDLIAHRRGGVVRIAERDLRAFLAAHRDQ